MNKRKTTDCLKFPELFDKPVFAIFDRDRESSDGGALIIRAADKKLNLTDNLCEAIHDRRQEKKVAHPLVSLLRQRIYAIACGYADCNDAGQLASDPVHRLIAHHDFASGNPLASQPTLSRLENSVTQKDLFRISDIMMRTVIERHHRRLRGRAKLVTIDLDPTDDATHGAQQLSFFNAFYEEHCYLPLLGFMTFNNENEQYLFAALLRPGKASAKEGAIGVLRRVFAGLRKKFPRIKIRVRLDGGFASPEIFTFLEESGVEYLINMGKNEVLKRIAEKHLKTVRRRAEKNQCTKRMYSEAMYKAASWHQQRRVIIKAEVTFQSERALRDNPRFVVTNMRHSPRKLYAEIYTARGAVENRIKELKHSLQIDRTSCTGFKANQFRVLLSAAAFILFQEIRLAAKRTSFAKAQVQTLQLYLIKIGAELSESVRRIVLHLPRSFPHLQSFRDIAEALGCVT